MSRKFFGLMLAAGAALAAGLGMSSDGAKAGFFGRHHHHGWCGGYAACGYASYGYASCSYAGCGYVGGYAFDDDDFEFDDDDACGWAGCGSWSGHYAAYAPVTYSAGYSAWSYGYSAPVYGAAPAFGYVPGPAYGTVPTYGYFGAAYGIPAPAWSGYGAPAAGWVGGYSSYGVGYFGAY